MKPGVEALEAVSHYGSTGPTEWETQDDATVVMNQDGNPLIRCKQNRPQCRGNERSWKWI